MSFLMIPNRKIPAVGRLPMAGIFCTSITLSFITKHPAITLSFITKHTFITLSFSKVNIK